MKIIEPAVELISQEDHPYKIIEKIGRLCYKSEDKIGSGTDKKFVKALSSRQHNAMLEHGYVFMTIDDKFRSELYTLPGYVKKFINIGDSHVGAPTLVTGSMRAWKELLAENTQNLKWTTDRPILWYGLRKYLQSTYPEIFGEVDPNVELGKKDEKLNKEIEYGDHFIVYSWTEIFERRNDSVYAEDIRRCLPFTLLLTTDRGVTHELVRHRPCSFAQESTRYCNYANGKFGREITVIKPWFADDPDKKNIYDIWKNTCEVCEKAYIDMVELDATPGEARQVLPNSTKAEIVMTATMEEWDHILDLRYYGKTGAPHAAMQQLMNIAAPVLNIASEGLLASSLTDFGDDI